MFRFALNSFPARFKPGKSAFCALSLLLMMAAWPPCDAVAKSRALSTTLESGRSLPDPDALLIEVYKSLSANNLRLAQTKADELVEAYPHFQLGHLIRGDLLLMHAQPVTTFGAIKDAPADKLKDLRDEAMVRIKSITQKPDASLIPRSILQLRDDQKLALVVDAKKSRLYLYENNGGQPRFVADYYVSQGKFGINKNKEGDQKTPIGIYYITSRLAGAKLPDFYGPGALPINYPNEWDKANGRSGSGIWLHGMPSENFSRPPLASDGCVVLTNPDFLKIAAAVDIGKTPVIISEQVEFVNKTKWNSDKQAANKLLDDWRLDAESADANRILANYSRNFKNAQGDNINAWFSKQQQFDAQHHPSIRLTDVTQFRYPGKDELIVCTFTQETTVGKSKSSTRKRQYWMKEASRWRIIYEGLV